MNKIKICFLSHHFKTPEIFLESILKMTPKRKGIWKNIVAVTNPNEADFYAIFDGYNGELHDEENKSIYFSQHPYTPYSPKHKMFENKKALLKFPLKYYLNPGEWWIEYDYDYLSTLKAPVKDKNLCCIVTYQTHHKMYSNRLEFLRKFVIEYSLDLYGRPSEKFNQDTQLKQHYLGALGNNTYDAVKGEHIPGKNILKNYKYSIEFDVGPCINYFSERLYDSLLLWCLPFYFGSTNLHEYIPDGSFEYINTNNSISKIIYCVNTDTRKNRLQYIAEARDLLLNKYQIWAYVHNVVNNIDKYRKEQKELKIL